MTAPVEGVPRRRALVWWTASLALALVVGLVLTWGVGALDRWGALPSPQTPAWYDCEAQGQHYAVQYLQGSDRLGLQWRDGASLQAESFSDRIEWRNAASLTPQQTAALPRAFRYESAQRLELVTAAQDGVVCQRRAAP